MSADHNLDGTAALVGDDEIYTARECDVGGAVDRIDGGGNSAQGVVDDHTGLWHAAREAHAALVAGYDQGLVGLGVGDAAVIDEYHVRHGAAVAEANGLHGVGLGIVDVEAFDEERVLFGKELLGCGGAVAVLGACNDIIVNSLAVGNVPVGNIGVAGDAGGGSGRES